MRTILLVEDERAHADVLAALLTISGYAVVVASTGDEAITQLAATRPDVILTDLMLPDMDGLALCRRLAQDAQYCTIPRILMSAGFRPRQLPRSLVAAFVAKPFLIEELDATLQTVLAHPAA